MHNQRDHVFIDCGPVGLAGRGGHGHNDCLSFEAVLDGIHLISDCGAYVYTASYMERNLFRSTAYHNTPQVKGEEINLIKPEYLWVLRYDAKPELIKWETDLDVEIFIGSHSGYQRLDRPLIPERTIRLERQKHILVVEDYFKGEGIYELSIPLYLAAGIEVQVVEPGILRLLSQNRHFILEWSQIDDWSLSIETARISPSYGRIVPSVKLLWQRNGLLKPLVIKIEPVEELLNDR